MTTPRRSPLGRRLREYRLAAGLSQAALAEAAGLSLRGVSDIERGLKARPHPATLRMLAEALGLDPNQRAELAAFLDSAADPHSPPLPAPVTQLVGRRTERAILQNLLAAPDTWLITITGPGGVGKTALARNLMEMTSPAAVTFVDLSVLPPGAGVEHLLASRLGGEYHEQDVLNRIRAVLRDAPRLLILDNCEHVIPGVQKVLSGLREVNAGRVVATSRAPLRLQGEQELVLHPFEVPRGEASDSDIAGSDAVAFLVQQSRAQRPELDHAKDLGALRTICERVDGLPLAIELAARRLRTIDPSTLASMLTQVLPVLDRGASDRPERHQSLENTIRWSFDLLSPNQQTVFQELSVFSGGFTLAQVADIATGGDRVAALNELEALVDAGLVRAAVDGRHHQLQTVREFGGALLTSCGNEVRVRAAHAAAMQRLLDEAEREAMSGGALDWSLRIRAEEGNLRAAVAWLASRAAVENSPADLFHLLNRLWPWWHRFGRHREMGEWLDAALVHGEHLPRADWAVVLLDIANTANNLADYDRSVACYKDVVRIGADLDDLVLIAQGQIGVLLVAVARREDELAASTRDAIAAHALPLPLLLPFRYATGRYHVARHELDAAFACFHMALDLVEADDSLTRAYLQLEEAQVERLRGNLDSAGQWLGDACQTFDALGEVRARAFGAIEEGHLSLAASQAVPALARFLHAAELAAAIQDEAGQVFAVEGIGVTALVLDETALAAQCHDVGRRWRQRTRSEGMAWEQSCLAPLSVLPRAGYLTIAQVVSAAASVSQVRNQSCPEGK